MLLKQLGVILHIIPKAGGGRRHHLVTAFDYQQIGIVLRIGNSLVNKFVGVCKAVCRLRCKCNAETVLNHWENAGKSIVAADNFALCTLFVKPAVYSVHHRGARWYNQVCFSQVRKLNFIAFLLGKRVVFAHNYQPRLFTQKQAVKFCRVKRLAYYTYVKQSL